uniref:Uncharacterized protein n=1 Tax=viral metagenome TaxID=1070528 RepID=A0A6C0EF61_9ZZZZ
MSTKLLKSIYEEAIKSAGGAGDAFTQSTDLIPDTTKKYDIGTTELMYNNVVSASARLDDLVVTTTGINVLDGGINIGDGGLNIVSGGINIVAGNNSNVALNIVDDDVNIINGLLKAHSGAKISSGLTVSSGDFLIESGDIKLNSDNSVTLASGSITINSGGIITINNDTYSTILASGNGSSSTFDSSLVIKGSSGLTVKKGGIKVTGESTITGNINVSQSVICASYVLPYASGGSQIGFEGGGIGIAKYTEITNAYPFADGGIIPIMDSTISRGGYYPLVYLKNSDTVDHTVQLDFAGESNTLLGAGATSTFLKTTAAAYVQIA